MLRSQGFALLEVLTAISILALSATIIYQTQAQSLRHLNHSLAQQRASLHAQSLLAGLTGPMAQRDPLSGETPDGYRWSATITPLQLPSPISAEETITMQRLDLTVSWQEGNKTYQTTLTTLDRP
jgi:general secretion pathway protein I